MKVLDPTTASGVIICGVIVGLIVAFITWLFKRNKSETPTNFKSEENIEIGNDVKGDLNYKSNVKKK